MLDTGKSVSEEDAKGVESSVDGRESELTGLLLRWILRRLSMLNKRSRVGEGIVGKGAAEGETGQSVSFMFILEADNEWSAQVYSARLHFLYRP